MGFNIADEKQIKGGEASDIYFERTIRNLPEGTEDHVFAEFTASGPDDSFFVFSGLDEVIELLKGKNVTVNAVPEGTLIPTVDISGIPVPVMTIEGKYRDFGELETAILGLISQSSGITTYASRVRLAAGDRPFISFGIRRMHPAISPMIDRATYIGGADGVSGILGAKLIGSKPFGTMPHSLSILLGDEEAWKITLKGMKKDEVKSLLIDTYMDEKFAAIKAAEMFPNLEYIRLDTPSSRRGNFSKIVREIRWELNLRGFNHIKIMVSGGLTVDDIKKLAASGVDSFGVGTSISSAEPVNFAMDIVEVAGESKTKRGKFSGRKQPFRCPNCGLTAVTVWSIEQLQCSCGTKMEKIFKTVLTDGTVKGKYESAEEIRKRTLYELWKFSSMNQKSE